jgi:hypothetical protein
MLYTPHQMRFLISSESNTKPVLVARLLTCLFLIASTDKKKFNGHEGFRV